MKQCKSGRIITKEKGGTKYYYLRLNIKITDLNQQVKYSAEEIPTNLRATKSNYTKASAMLGKEIEKYNYRKHGIYFHIYCSNWLYNKRISIEITTYESYAYRIRIINSYFKNHPVAITELTSEHIYNFYHYLLFAEHGEGKRHTVGYSNRTIKDIAVLINAILNDAVILNHIEKNPAKYVKRPRKIEDMKRKSYISVSEVPIFLDAIHGHQLEIPLLIGLYYGLRREEILGLKWSAIHPDGRLYIEHTVSQTKTLNPKDRVKTSASYRSYPISKTLLDKLHMLKLYQQNQRNLLGEEYFDSDYMFTWEDGRCFTPNYLTKEFKKIIRRNPNLDDTLTLHSLRASCISILVHEGIDIKDIQEWVGHKDIQTTLNIYARINEKEKEKVNQKMSEILFK